MNRLAAACALVCCGALHAAAQAVITDDEDIQSWNDVQLTAPLGKSFDFHTAVTMRFGKNATRLNDGRFAVGVTWKPTARLAITPFYLNVRARNSRSQFRREDRFNLRAQFRFPLKSFGLIHRSTYEYRMRSPENTWRYRAMLTAEKDLPKSFIKQARVYVSDEAIYDSATEKFSRNRFSLGVNKTLNQNLSVDVYYMRQNDGYSHPGDLNIVGLTWRVKL